MDRREINQLRAALLQHFQIVVIVEIKGFVPGHCDARSRRIRRMLFSIGAKAQRRCRARDREQSIQVDRLCQDVCQMIDLFLQIRHFGRLHKPQMAALPHKTVVLRHIADDL